MKYLIFLVPLFFLSCHKSHQNSSIYLYGTYTNYVGEQPTFTVDANKSTNGVTYVSDTVFPTVTVVGNRIRVLIRNVRLKLGGQGYIIDSFNIQELNNVDNQWHVQAEFQTTDTSNLTKLVTVLVLDMSSSIGADLSTLKYDAKDFCNTYLSHNTGSIALVLFNNGIYSYDFSTSANYVNNIIDTFSNIKDFTTLYGAVETGLSMLDTFSQPVDNKVLIAFTDGGDNNTNSPNTALNSIKASPRDRYAIGVIGQTDYNSDALSNYIASAPSNFVQASNYSSLQNAFDKIYSLISSISQIEYDRTPQTFTNNVDAAIQVRIQIFGHPNS